MQAEAKSYKENYSLHWLALALLVAVPSSYQWSRQHLFTHVVYQRTKAHLDPAPVPEDADWFFLLRMPAITNQYESGISVMQVRYGLWLDALAKNGYRPMKLSDVRLRLAQGKKLPEKTVVLMFDPGFRRTYGLIEPILKGRGWPAVWITSEPLMKKGHREYVTYHAANQMVQSGWWDVGFVQSNGTLRLRSRDHGDIILGDDHHPVWGAVAGGMALNHGTPFSLLDRLNVNSDWTPVDLLARVRVELPAMRRVFLTKTAVQNLTWGVITEDENDPGRIFDVQIPAYKRGVALDWFGTKGIANSHLHAEAQSLVGDFTIRLRWNEEKGDGISVLVSNEQLFVQELQNFHVKGTYRADRSDHGMDGRFQIDLEAVGNALTVSLDGHRPFTMALQNNPDFDKGLVQLFLVDRLRGSARAKAVQMTFVPLENRNAKAKN